MGRSAGLVGAGLLAADALFAPEMLGGWITSGTPRRHPEVKTLLARIGPATAAGAEPAPPPAKRRVSGT